MTSTPKYSHDPAYQVIDQVWRAWAYGLYRAILRRDYLSAARLARWIALDEHPDP